MKLSIDNPKTNILGAGITESDLAGAIKHSGYPLQTVIANILRNDFNVQEEWGYIDKDSKDQRTIDLLAEKALYDESKVIPIIRPSINLLIECKQSDLPYVFLLSPTKPLIYELPTIAGLAKDRISIITDDCPDSWSLNLHHIFGLESHKFIKRPPVCYTLSKGIRKGKDLELSGSETYNGLVLPLIKSLLHFQYAETPPETFLYFQAKLVFCVGVLNAPMVGVNIQEEGNEQILLPWVRVLRNEYFENLERPERSKQFVIDIVHKDFFQEYIDQYALPYANEFATLILKHQKEISSGNGFVSNMNKSSWNNLESRLFPRDTKTKTSRIKAIFIRIFRLLTGRIPV